MLHDVKVRTFDRVRKTELIEILTVDTSSGDDAAQAALDLRPGGTVVGVTVQGGFGPVGGAAIEADDTPPEDEDSEPGPSNRELASMPMMRPRPAPSPPLAAPDPDAKVFIETDGKRASLDDELDKPAAVKRGPGRPRKEPQT
jgi:hypothetical protein